MYVIKKIDKKLHRGDTVVWTLKFKDKNIDINEFYKFEKINYTVGDNDVILNDISKVIKGKGHLFKLFNDNPFDGGNVVLNFLDDSITGNERNWNYGDRVDVNKEIGDEIEYTIMKTGYVHKGSIKNYVISSKYKDLPIIGEGIQFTDDDLIEKKMTVITLQNYDGGNMDSYLIRRNGEEIIDEITINDNNVSFACKLNDTVSFELRRGNKSYDEHIIINETMYENGTTGKTFDFETLNEEFVIKVNNKKISDITEIGYGYSGDRNILLQFEKPNIKGSVEIISNINDIDFESGYYEDTDKWKIIFTPNTTSKDKNYKLTFTANYYKPYVWSFVQKHAIEGTLTWSPQDLTYDTTNTSTVMTGVQITEAIGTLTPYYEILEAKLSSIDATSYFQSALNNNTGYLSLGKLLFKVTGKYKITMQVTGQSNKTYIKPSTYPPIQKSFYITVKLK